MEINHTEGGKPDSPRDIKVEVIANTAKITWIIPSNQGVMFSRIFLNNSKEGDMYLDQGRKFKDIPVQSSTVEIANLKMCSEYDVRIHFIGRSGWSDYTTQKFWMTDNSFTADIHENIELSWTTSMTDFFVVMSPKQIIYFAQGNYIISNSIMKKYIYDQMSMNVSAIKITVNRVNKADAGLYISRADSNEDMVDGCCLLIVTSKPINTTVTLQPEHPFVGGNITLTCSSTIQRWPEAYKTSHLSYQFHGNTRGATDNNKLQIHKLTKSDKGTSIQCQATDDLGKSSNMSNTVTLDPYYSPQITDIWFSSDNQRYGLRTPGTFIFNEEENVKMTLRVESNPDPQIIFKSSLFKMQPIKMGNGYTDYTSNLPTLKCVDSGNFSIQASNGIPYADTRMVTLEIRCKPRNATAESDTVGAKIGSVENIVLHVISFPAPNVRWERVTGFTWKIEKDRYDYRHKIHSKIRIRSEVDFGVYGINICNRLGCIVENITLKPQDKPEAPQNVSVVTITFRSVNLSWIAGFNGGLEQTFTVQFKTIDNDKWNVLNVHINDVMTGSTIYYTLDQLRPDTSYQVTVVSTNLQGQRNTSLEFKTEVYIGRRNKYSKSDLKEKNVKSEKSDEYTIIQRNNPTFTDAYSTLQSPTESTALPTESMETNTYDECGVLANVEVYETMDDRKSGNIKDEQGSVRDELIRSDNVQVSRQGISAFLRRFRQSGSVTDFKVNTRQKMLQEVHLEFIDETIRNDLEISAR
ncbi:unnamed protein product [Mytilus edulis]|uniref:Fibronectin type-III domain-containing protein n=1 Tax=Mytilus edulis TaxID=6550 RepID=A0A8S3U8W2_MYTED|nr:unnamed protein product [Mytilus edulis]